jgi:hypothetical protein
MVSRPSRKKRAEFGARKVLSALESKMRWRQRSTSATSGGKPRRFAEGHGDSDGAGRQVRTIEA